MALPPDIERPLRFTRALPSIPGVAARLLELADAPNAGLPELASVVQRDPALVAKLIRAAATPGRAGARKIATLIDALAVLGFNGAYTLSLGFLLLGAWDTRALEPIWRRSVIAGEAGRVIVADLRIGNAGEVYLGALLQDIGRLAMRVVVDGYDATDQAANNEALAKHEQATWGTTHAEVGAWLAERWGLPSGLVNAIRRSHEVPSVTEGISAVHCVALSGRFADLFLVAGDELRIAIAQRAAARIAGYEQDDIDRLVCALAAKIPEAESVFQCELVDSTVRAMLDSAKELLQIRCVAEQRAEAG